MSDPVTLRTSEIRLSDPLSSAFKIRENPPLTKVIMILCSPQRFGSDNSIFIVVLFYAFLLASGYEKASCETHKPSQAAKLLRCISAERCSYGSENALILLQGGSAWLGADNDGYNTLLNLKKRK